MSPTNDTNDQAGQIEHPRLVTGHITASDFINANTLARKRKRRIPYVCWTLLLAIGLGFLMYGHFVAGMEMIVLSITMILATIVAYNHIEPNRIKHLHHQRKAFSDPITISWDETLFMQHTAQGHGRMPWMDYVCYKEDQAVILLYHDDSLYTLVPKRWFQDTAQLNDFRQQLQQVGR